MQEKAVSTISRSDYSRPKAAAATSPFRYPGGKAFLTDFVERGLKELDMRIEFYVEPFAGGAGAALNLLNRQAVERVVLNDLDIRMYSAWRAMLEENERFLEKLQSVSVDVATWKKCREIVTSPTNRYSFDLGFATFFINRTSRGGIVLGSGPTGGYKQESVWKIDARFYRETMLRRCKWIGDNAKRIAIHQERAISFLRKCAATLPQAQTYYFIDPPYVAAGSRLYFNAMSPEDHAELSTFLIEGNLKNWVLTYDNHPLIRKLYSTMDLSQLEVGYSLRRSRNEKELLISSLEN